MIGAPSIRVECDYCHEVTRILVDLIGPNETTETHLARRGWKSRARTNATGACGATLWKSGSPPPASLKLSIEQEGEEALSIRKRRDVLRQRFGLAPPLGLQR